MALCFGYSHQNMTLDEVYLRQMEAVDRFPHQESFFIKRVGDFFRYQDCLNLYFVF